MCYKGCLSERGRGATTGSSGQARGRQTGNLGLWKVLLFSHFAIDDIKGPVRIFFGLVQSVISQSWKEGLAVQSGEEERRDDGGGRGPPRRRRTAIKNNTTAAYYTVSQCHFLRSVKVNIGDDGRKISPSFQCYNVGGKRQIRCSLQPPVAFLFIFQVNRNKGLR